MRIEKLKNVDIDIEVGDIVESRNSGLIYLITKSDNGEYAWVELINSRNCMTSYETVKGVVNSISENYIVHKKENIKLVIE